MTGRTKRTCHRRGKGWFRAGVLCCALLIPLSISTNVVRAAPLTRDGPLGDLSGPWNHKWLAFTYTWGPPEGATEMQKAEWAIGFYTAMAGICGNYGKVAEVRGIMKKSPYFMKGYFIINEIEDKIAVRNCGQHLSTLQEVLGRKEKWEIYLDAAYPSEAPPPAQEPPTGKASGEAQKILTYLQENKRAVFRKMSKFLEENSVVPEGNTTNRLLQIRNYKVLRVDGDRAFVAINFETGLRGGSFSDPYRMIFELRWIDGELEFVGHEKS